MTFNETNLLAELSHDQLRANQTTKRFVVAYSGGMDSHVLLAAMSVLRGRLGGAEVAALHVHHGISPEADAWVEHCVETCRLLDVPLNIKKIKVDRTQASLENSLRNARYQAFSESLNKQDVLLLAHHADDQAETIFLRLLRGAGAQGVSGMPACRVLGNAYLYRPMLGYTRQELAHYAITKQLRWIEDDSNVDVQFDRNFLRQNVLPLITERWPGFGNSLTRHARINQQLQHSMDFFLARELEQLVGNEGKLNLSLLRAYTQEVQLNLVRAWIASLALPVPSYQQLEQIVKGLIVAREDAQPQVNWRGATVRRFQNNLYASAPLPAFDKQKVYELTPDQPLDIPGVGALELVNEEVVKADNGEGWPVLKLALAPLSVRFRQGGERCQPAGRVGSHPLKKLFQEYQVPPWLRDRMPLIYCGEQLVAAGDLWVCEGFTASPGEQGRRLVLN
ncbi:MAG: tRNA lysidine(34) synthetase TilS [Pseudomonadales bacterium]|nr:tRNA lysidine(34) synthetase TilS [Pseudomonadales bacterium]MCP5302573.1 tRNA lysidine(34) synthetase TilS [Pseudomonadales bacterium]